MTDEQWKKISSINEAVAPTFRELDELNAKIRHYEKLIDNAKKRRDALTAELDSWESRYTAVWEEIFAQQEAE